MRWKKYIIGMTVMSMFFTLPLVSAEDDDIVVYGDEFEPKAETVSTDNDVPIDEGNTIVETPEEQINESENTTEVPEETQTEPPEDIPVENVNQPEVQEPIEEIKPEVEVENLNTSDSTNNFNDANKGNVGDSSDNGDYNENQPVETPVEDFKPEIEVENLNTSDNTGNVGTTDDGNGDSSYNGNYNDNPSIETPVEEIKPEVEVDPFSSETPVDNPPFEENINYTGNESLNEGGNISTGETGNVTEVPFGNTTSGSGGELGTNDPYNNGVSEGENGYTTNVTTPVTTSGDTSNPYTEGTTKKSSTTENDKKLKKQKARFVKLLSDETYEYYLDRSAVRWISMPYSTSEYMADVWIRMIEKSPNTSGDNLYQYLNSGENEIADAAEKGIDYAEVDKKVLRSRKYFLEHYYIRPKTKQIQFLCELEVIGRPQNAVSERPYEYKNWENLIPGSVESYIYNGVLSEIGTSKASKRNHMTFIDMLDEYARIALN
ncbi:MAG: hypothetical protein IJ862_05890 [Selenomonadaceae bacterium]|nr:hypothetical protein [Selenomonadaceae bacterium]